jgi:hypothetical protein
MGKLDSQMKYGKWGMLIGALTIVASTTAFEWATFYDSYDNKIFSIAFFGGPIGLIIWLVGCVRICRTIPGRTLLGAGILMLFFLFFTVALLDHISPVFFNAHLGIGGMLAPVTACLLGGLMFIVAGIVRIARD